ncbi:MULTISPECIES: zinc transporter ZupT [unclassified Pseudodesulfovibrio]|uniref:zinc transporter ZupT n=1 Tax=unclassified Pseudodesulfovibrio TaxID=2661612 RepID=UPI000FEBD410|nr:MULTISPECIES: zinc transporter ZupT [unclassified Pseudodesulfovibrio]MCJ2165615.1 zinc transporter ZupT [Pseudodesulfovibrio sp. S3-i]RWU03023.1 zinc transporter ZupT [Pseudodesulfovibrio sp. S3]
MDSQTVLYAFGLTLFAGLSTGIGSAIAFFARRTNTKFLSLALGFSAGVMIYVSFVEILVKARDALTIELGEFSAAWVTALSFFGGIAFIAVIDKFVPSYENPHEMHSIEEMDEGKENLPKNEAHNFDKLRRTGVFAAIAIAIHNFPEGLATFTAALTDPALGTAIAVAIAIHNIPEGIAVSIPLFYATGDRKKAFFYSFLSGLSEPVGALIGYLILMPFFTPTLFGVLFAGVGGIMVFISLDELLPAAEEFGEHHLAIYGLIAGMVVMALSLLLFL